MVNSFVLDWILLWTERVDFRGGGFMTTILVQVPGTNTVNTDG